MKELWCQEHNRSVLICADHPQPAAPKACEQRTEWGCLYEDNPDHIYMVDRDTAIKWVEYSNSRGRTAHLMSRTVTTTLWGRADA